jgi:hypothetical protein
MTGLPSIVAGLFAYALFVIVFGPGVRMGFGGSIALSNTIVIVTPNMQQAARVSDDTGFFNLARAGKPGCPVEMSPTRKIFSDPDDPSTEAYVSGRFG